MMPKCLLKTASRTATFSLPKLLLGLLLVLSVALVLQACGSDVADSVPLDCNSVTSSDSEIAPDVLRVACDNSNFAFDLYRELSDGEDNLFFSPFSISRVLAMAYAGARGETERQMAEILRYNLPQERLHPTFGAIENGLNSREDVSKGSSNPDEDEPLFLLSRASAAWAQEGLKFHQYYLDILDNSYGEELRPLDFAAALEESRATISNWAEEETGGRIEEPISHGELDSFARFVLTDAIYFNAQWLLPFYPNDTTEEQFRLPNGIRVKVPMMNKKPSTWWTGYARGDGYQAVNISYFWIGVSMIVLLPDKGRFEEFEDSLAAGIIDQIRENWESRYVTLSMPRFKFNSSFALKDVLTRMGMIDPFDEAADFSGISNQSKVRVSDIFHNAYVSVDELGTEAPEPTIFPALNEDYSPSLEPITVTLDRPFIFLIRDEPTGAILFLGRVMDPS